MKSARRLLSVGALCVAMLSGVGCVGLNRRAVCPEEGGYPWHEVTSQHFLLRTNMEQAEAQRVALDLEKFRSALLLAWSGDFDPPGRLEVIALRNSGQITEFIPWGYSGFTAHVPFQAPVIVVDGGTEVAARKARSNVQAHELVHYLSRFVLLRQPRWVAEGLASYLETVHLSQAGTEVMLGWPHPNALSYVRSRGVLKLDKLWRWDEEALSSKDSTWQYASSWLWIYYLANAHEERFADFQGRLARAEEPRKAFEEAFAGVANLEEGLEEYLESGRFLMHTLPLPPVSSSVAVRELKGPEIHVLRARLHLLGSVRASPEAARQAAADEIKQGLKEDPTHESVVLLQAELTRNPQERLATARKLVKTWPESGRAWRLLAQALQATGSPVAEQEQALVRAVELMPDDPYAHNELAWFYATSSIPRKGYESAVRAVQLAPYASEIVDTYAAVLFGMGRCSRSINAQRRAIDLLSESVAPEMRQGYMLRLSLYEKVCRQRATAAAAEEP